MKNWCWNDSKPVKATDPDCVVGSIRKHRNKVSPRDGTCGTCPYFIEKPKA